MDPASTSTFEAGEEPSVVLVVEDEVLIRLHVADFLRDCGLRVLEAANADEAVAILQHGPDAVDLVFSDINMPGSMNGFELASWIRGNRPDTRVILASGVPQKAKLATDICEDGVLAKPYDHRELVARIRRLLAKDGS
jgi:CheY-like chemotaxis protein